MKRELQSSFGLKQPQTPYTTPPHSHRHTHTLNPCSRTAAVETLLLAHGLNYLSVCLWLPLRAVVSRAQVLCGPELLTDTPPPPPSPPSVCVLSHSSLHSKPRYCRCLRVDTDSVLFYDRSQVPPFRLLASSAAFFLFHPRRQFEHFYLDRLSEGMQRIETR